MRPIARLLGSRSLRLEPLELRALLTAAPLGPAPLGVEPAAATAPPYQNQTDPFDVNASGSVEPLDALIVINDLNLNGPRALPAPTTTPEFFIDVNGDGGVSSIDALDVINVLNAGTQATPTLFGPTSLSAASPGTLSLAGPQQILAVDNDATSTQSIALSVATGKLDFDTATGATVSSGATGSSALTLSGTLSQLDAALATLTYTLPAGVTATTDVLTAKASDGALSSPVLSIPITIAADAAPVLSGPTALGASPGVAALVDSPAIQISDTDAGQTIETIELSVTSGVLNYTAGGGATVVAGAGGTNALTLSGTIGQLNTALATLTYTAPDGSTQNDTLVATANDGSLASNTLSVPITVSSEAAPVVSGPTSLMAISDEISHVNSPAFSIADADAGSGNETVTLTAAQGTLQVTDFSNLIVGGANSSGSLTLTGPLSSLNTALSSLLYTPAGTDTSDTITVTANDGILQSNVVTLPVTVTIDAAPVVTGPTSLTVPPAATSVFSSPAFSITDSDAGSTLETVKIQTGAGTVSYNTAGGSSATVIAGALGTNTFTLQGTLTNLNLALQTLALTVPENLSGTSSSFSVEASDGTKSTTDLVNLTVQVAQSPVLTGPSALSVTQQGTANVTTPVISISDPSYSGTAETIKLTVQQGTLNVTASGIDVVAGKNGTSTLTLQGSVTQLNSWLQTLEYVTPTSSATSDTLTAVASDSVVSSQTLTVPITIKADLAPTIQGPMQLTAFAGTPLQVNSPPITINDPDGPSTETIQLSVVSGTIGFQHQLNGATIVSGQNNSNAFALNGTVSQLNAILATLSYTAPSDGTTNDTLSVMASDGLHSSQTFTCQITI